MAEQRKVEIRYSPDLSRIGKTETMAAEDAAVLVREGRAVYVDEGSKSAGNGTKSEQTKS